MADDTRILIPRALFSQMRAALIMVDEVLNADGTRFHALDQNPHGVRDLVGSAALAVERFVEKGEVAMPDRIDRKPLMPRIIRTVYWAKPIPLRQFDWIATAEDYEPGDPVGYGLTEQAAVDDLAEQYLEIEESTR